MSIPPFVEYHPFLIDNLRDPQQAVAYLNAAMEEGDTELLILALKDVSEAHGGLDKLAEKIHFVAA